MGEDQTRPTGRRTAVWRLSSIAAAAALTVGLFWAYLLQSRMSSGNSDAAAQALQGWQLVHGHLLLRGWFLSDVSFYTFEVPVDGLVALVTGLKGDVIHVAAALEYALLVLFAALVAAGASRDRRRGELEAWVRGLIAAGIMVAPGTNPGEHVLLLAPDHTGIGVPVLIALLVVDRLRPRRVLPLAGTAALVCLLLIWAQLDDPVAEFSCAAPLALACAAPLAWVPVRRLAGVVRARGGRPAAPAPSWRDELDRHGYDIALLLAAVVSFGLTQVVNRAINSLGGFYLHAIPAKSQISPWSTVPSQVRTLGQNLMYLFGANWWIRPQPLTAYAYLHLVGLAVAVIGLLIGLWGWRRADRVTRTLVIALFAVFAAGAVSPLMQPITGAHEIAIMLPISAALAGRVIGPWLAGRRAAADDETATVAGEAGEVDRADRPARPGRAGRVGRRTPAVRIAVACVLIAVGVGYLSDLGYNAAQPSRPSVNQELADWLVAHHLTSGLGGYWDADVTALASGGRVTIAPLVDGGRYGYPWESKASWFNPKVSSANFVIAHVQNNLGSGYLSVSVATAHYGKPAREYFLGKTVVLVYDRDLLTNVIQPTPAYLYGPPR